MINPNTDVKAARGSVDAMAEALSAAEKPLVEAMQTIGTLPVAMELFGVDIGTHWTYLPFGEVAEAMGMAGKAFELLAAAHKRLDNLRKLKNFPEPGPQPLNGGGGGKP